MAAVLLAAFGACDDQPATRRADDCGLPTPGADVDAALLPAEFLVDGAEVVKVERSKVRLTAALNVRRSVADSFDLYREAARDAGFDLVGSDNEGFEAEVYMKKGKDLGTIQIRTSTCADASVVFVNIVRT